MSDSHDSNNRELTLYRNRSLAIRRSELVARGLALIHTLQRRRIDVLIGDIGEDIAEFIGQLIKEVINNKHDLNIRSFFHGEELLEHARNNPVDIFILVLNNVLFRSDEDPQEYIKKRLQLISEIRALYGRTIIVFYGSVVTPELSSKADLLADFTFQLPFKVSDFMMAIQQCLDKLPGINNSGYDDIGFCLGWTPCHSRGEQLSDEMKVYYYKKAADQGFADAQQSLGLAYQQGWGVSANDEEAVKWFRKAAIQGYAESQLNLWYAYVHGEGVPKNHDEAIKWLRKAANQGHGDAQYELGLAYHSGDVVTLDDEEAVKWYRRAADQGHADAQFKIGLAYINGKGVPENSEEAIKWYKKAADQGNSVAQFWVALNYDNQEDYVNAFEYLCKAADQGNADAQLWLGDMYVEGKGVPKDYVKAYMWYSIAAIQYGKETVNRGGLSKNISVNQIAEAQKLAKEWEPKSLCKWYQLSIKKGI